MTTMRSGPALLFVACAALATSAGAEIYRCAAGGTVTYQEIPCADGALARIDIPTSYPAPNTAERDRLLQREAELYKRLEARRNRELVEAQMREARAEREAERERLAALEAQALQQYTVAYPAWRAYPGRRPAHYPMQHGRQAFLR